MVTTWSPLGHHLVTTTIPLLQPLKISVVLRYSIQTVKRALTHPEGQSMVVVRGAAEVEVAKRMNKKEAAIRTLES